MAEIPKAYEPQSVENRWYQFWLDERLFVADAKSPKPAYSIVIPPPNVTGVLHMRSEEHTSELQSRFGTSHAVFCFKKKKEPGTGPHFQGNVGRPRRGPSDAAP